MRNLFYIVICTLSFVSCKVPSLKEVESGFVGKWILSASVYPEDSIYIHNTLIILNIDSTFTSSSAFYFRDVPDSIKKMSFNGYWSINVHGPIDDLITSGRAYDRLIIKKDSVEYIWGIFGSAGEGKMYWSVNDIGSYTLYTWALVKDN